MGPNGSTTRNDERDDDPQRWGAPKALSRADPNSRDSRTGRMAPDAAAFDVASTTEIPSANGYSVAFEGIHREYWHLSVRSGETSAGLVVALHPFGGTPAKALDKFGAVLTEYGFDVVAPKGYESSWNAAECCGAARAARLNDTEFVSLVVNQVLSYTGRPMRAFVTGFSNGGFMTSLLALQAAARDPGFEWIAGAASIAGEVFDPSWYRRAASCPDRAPVPTLIVHGMRDDSVRYAGCCDSKGARCCCGILSSVCAGTEASFEYWTTINKCLPSQRVSVSVANTTAIECFEGVSCAAPTLLCPYPEAGHAVEPDMVRRVAAFFASLASRPHSPSLVPPSTTAVGGDSGPMLALIMLIAVLSGLWVVSRWKRSRRDGRAFYERVATTAG